MREMPGVHIDQNRCSHKSECAEFIRDDLNLSIYMTNNSNRTFELLTKGVYSDNKAISDVTA